MGDKSCCLCTCHRDGHSHCLPNYGGDCCQQAREIWEKWKTRVSPERKTKALEVLKKFEMESAPFRKAIDELDIPEHIKESIIKEVMTGEYFSRTIDGPPNPYKVARRVLENHL